MDKEVKEKKVCKQQVVFCVLVVLHVFVSLLFSLPVHAAEGWTLSSNPNVYTLTYEYSTQSLKYSNTLEFDLQENYFYALVRSDDFLDINGHYDMALYYFDSNNSKVVVYNYPEMGTFTQTRTKFDDGSVYESVNKINKFENQLFDIETAKTDLPFFDSESSMLLYCLSGDSSGIINGGSIDNPDFQDTAYAFTGFTANSKMTATWTGTTERSYLKDEDVEEYVRVSYGFAAKDAPDSIKQVDNDSKEYSTAAKSLTVKVSGLVPDDDSWFLRYVQVVPCYRQAGLGVWGDFYHGESSYVYFNADGSIDKIVAPYVKGSLSADMERPVIVLHEAANGNPTESDYSYFEFNNAREDYFFEMKGRWYTTNDFDIYRDKLVWKYKYSTLLKNDLSTWVTVADGKNSVGKFQFDILGKSSWENLITSYPVDDRNYIGGSYALVNKITGYSDAVDTLKMLLKQPYSLYNGYEVYVRYYRYDENGSIEYSKWTHFYNNLANSEGSSGSRLDDLDNMYSENQSDKGLTDDELSDLENTGNSRNDLDAVPKNNYDYSSLETATMNFFDLLTNYGSMLGQFPSMVTAVFGFLPAWLIGLIAVAIGAVIVCRFIGR